MSSCAAWRSLATGGLWWPGVEGLKWSFLLFFFLLPVWVSLPPGWAVDVLSAERVTTCVSMNSFRWQEGRKEGRSVGWLVGLDGGKRGFLQNENPKKKRCEGFKCQWLLHQLLAALVAADISPDGRSASLLFNVALLRFVYLVVFFIFLSSTCKFYIYRFFRFHFFNLASTRGSRETFFPIFRKATVQKSLFWFGQWANWRRQHFCRLLGGQTACRSWPASERRLKPFIFYFLQMNDVIVASTTGQRHILKPHSAAEVWRHRRCS